MRRVWTAAAIAATLALGASADAKTLEEILKEKGVITDEEYEEASKKSDYAYYKPGRGITVESEDGRFVAHIGGRLQARYEYEDFDNDSGDDNVSTFRIRSMKVWLRGKVFSKNLYYKYQQNLNETEDAYLGYEFMDWLDLSVGQMKPPQARQELTSSGSQMFVDRSLANDTFNLGRDIGLQASGHVADHLVEYALGVFNGNGTGELNVDNHHMFAARLDVNPLGRFKMDEPSWGEDRPLVNIGGSFMVEKLTDADAGNLDSNNDAFDKALEIDGFDGQDFLDNFGSALEVTLYTVNLHGKWLGASVGGEYYFLNADPDTGSDWDATGYYIQGGYTVLPKTLELAVRYSAIDTEDNDAPADVLARAKDQSEFQVGVNYYFAKHNAKLQADYTNRQDDTGDTDFTDNIFRVQAQLIF